MKINFDVAIRQEGSYIAVSCRDSSSFLCTAYMERIQAVDPFMGETMAAVRAVELALEKRWTHVLFESDSMLLCDDLASELPPCWKVEAMISSLQQSFKAQSAWALHWVPRRLNQQAHLLAQWAAHLKISGFMDSSCIPLSILSCDLNAMFG